MGEHIKIELGNLTKIRDVDPRLMSYNVEMTEVTGGTFWKAYTPEQVAGTEEFVSEVDFRNMGALMQMYPPVDLASDKIRRLSKAFGPVWVRVSGTWANKTYYDFEGTTNGVSPEGFQNILSKEQWLGLLDFVKAVDGKLLISVANCAGIHSAHEPWHPGQAEQIFKLSKEYGVPIAAAEFTNEPNMLNYSGMPADYTAADYARDQDIFFKWVRENYPEVLCVGPCSIGEAPVGPPSADGISATEGMQSATTAELLDPTTEKLDVFSYHYYNGVSERGGKDSPAHWPYNRTITDEYLAVAGNSCKIYMPKRDTYAPGAQMWVTESGDAGCGGNTWGSTFTDVFRTANELAAFSKLTDGVIFHNTLASSDYGFLAHGTFDPRPNYWIALLWNKLMGTEVFETNEEQREGAHVYAHSRRDGKSGKAYLIINNSKTEATTVELPKEAEVYKLNAEHLRAPEMMLNGKVLRLTQDHQLPELLPEILSGTITLEPCTLTFVLI